MTSHKSKWKSIGNWIFRHAIVALVVLFVLFVAYVQFWNGFYLPRVHAKYGEFGEARMERLDQIWAAIYGFNEENGRWPSSVSEIATIESDIASLLKVPHLEGAAYEIDFSVLGPELTREVVIGDPGYEVTGPYSWRGGNERGLGRARWALLADGDIVNYHTIENEARHKARHGN